MGSRTLPLGVLCALPEELGSLPSQACGRRELQGLSVHEIDVDGVQLLACAGGVGKVLAARAATLLASQDIRGLLVVGTCGGLRKNLGTGTLVHCTTAFQTDLALREERSIDADPAWRAAWQALHPGPEGWFLTADRPVISPWRRLRLARAFLGPCVADMETAAAAAVARRAGLPWAALRAVTDLAGIGSARSFRRNFPIQAGRAADSVLQLASRLPPALSP